jgi:hypothetical protein
MTRALALAALLGAVLPLATPAQADPCAAETRSNAEITREIDADQSRLLGADGTHLESAERVLRLAAVYRAMTREQIAAEQARLNRQAQALRCAQARLMHDFRQDMDSRFQAMIRDHHSRSRVGISR